MSDNRLHAFITNVVANMPKDWLNLTTHRLDIYNESLAKTEFLDQFEEMYATNTTSADALYNLPTAYDYIRLGHPLSSVLEWTIAKQHNWEATQVIAFGSQTTPLLAVLRKNLFEQKKTRVLYIDTLPHGFDADKIRSVYGYSFEVTKISKDDSISSFDGTTVLITEQRDFNTIAIPAGVDFSITLHENWGSVIVANGQENKNYISEIQHVRRRETIAMTPANCYSALQLFIGGTVLDTHTSEKTANKQDVIQEVQSITGTKSNALFGSSGLSIQYAIVMGLVDHALENHPGKDIKIIVPPNCYGGTNDQARRVAACSDKIDVMDLPVDGGNNMVNSIAIVLDEIARMDAVPLIIAEIPTNPRVEVPDLEQLRDVLSQERTTPSGSTAIDPVFILDQTFCPNVQFLPADALLSSVRTISYVSGSKFPSGGKCTAGYCVANAKAESLLVKIGEHLTLCDNEATDLQYALLAEQMPSMLQRIQDAYVNTRKFVTYIEEVLPTAKINFVSEELAAQGFTPSVFSLDLPTKGATDEEREMYKRELNNTLITKMITEIPSESKYCVSYGQLKGCYWTIPATSTQGTTKEGDKDYIARVALSANMDLAKHMEVFKAFVEGIG